MKLHLPTYLGGYEVETVTELGDDEEIIGWVDEYGTITSSKVNTHIGDLVMLENSEISALVVKKGVEL